MMFMLFRGDLVSVVASSSAAVSPSATNDISPLGLPLVARERRYSADEYLYSVFGLGALVASLARIPGPVLVSCSRQVFGESA